MKSIENVSKNITALKIAIFITLLICVLFMLGSLLQPSLLKLFVILLLLSAIIGHIIRILYGKTVII